MLPLQTIPLTAENADMNLTTSLSGRLRNTNLPKKNALFPLFEAIVNSIHAIDERVEQDDFNLEDSNITVNIIRSAQLTTDGSKPETTGFRIEDNGIGFNTKNYDSFMTLDSEYKAAKGCKGIGRLIWLKAFASVSVESVYQENGAWYKRTFTFNREGVFNEKLEDVNASTQLTTISLNNLNAEYLPGIFKTADTIAEKVIDHCFWYFLRDGGAPNIQIIDVDNDCANLNAIFEYSKGAEIVPQTITIKGVEFELTHIKLREGSPYSNSALYGAANRLVLTEDLKPKIQGLYGNLDENGTPFSYVCFVSSQYLTDNVSPERLSFNIPEKPEDLAFTDISLEEIKESVVQAVSSYLSDYLEDNMKRTEERLTTFVNTQEPRYRSILRFLTPEDKAFNPDIKDSQLELRLHKRLMEVESQLMTEGRNLVNDENLDDEEYTTRLLSYLDKAIASKSSDLANYVAKRKVILDLFEKALRRQENGRFVREEVVHRLIMPMRETTETLPSEECANLWLINERLAFHSYLASDKTIKSMPISDSDSTKEPDLCSLKVFDNPILVNEGSSMPLASITIVELKRPMRDDGEPGQKEDPIMQALTYLDKIRTGKAKLPGDRPIPKSEEIPGYCYIICDLTDSMIRCCKGANLQVTSDNMGYFGYNANFKAYIEVMSFDQLVRAAKERNRMFFQKLGIPSGL